MEQIILPRRLKTGDRIGVIATSSPIEGLETEIVDRAYSRIRQIGLDVIEAPNCRQITGHTAGTIQTRVDALHDFVSDPSIHGVIAFWGGYQTHQLLEYLDFDLFAANPKPIIGYSDLTPLLNAITSRTGLVTFSGPAVITFAKPTLFEYTLEWFKRVLFEGGEKLEFHPADVISTNLWFEREDLAMVERASSGWKTYNPGKAQGRLFGGNLGSLLLLSGTPYWPNLDGAILFVEEDEVETPNTIDRLFTNLRQMGTYGEIAGMVIGRFPDSVEFTEQDQFIDILDVALSGYDLPVLYDCDFGHTDPLLTLPIGAMAEMDATTRKLRLVGRWNQ